MMELDAIAEFVEECRHPDGGYASSPGLDPHMLYTLSAVQVGAVVILACPPSSPCLVSSPCSQSLARTGDSSDRAALATHRRWSRFFWGDFF